MRTELRAAQDTVVTQTWARLSCSQFLTVPLLFPMNYNGHVHFLYIRTRAHARDSLGYFAVGKYKDDPNWWTHSRLREGYGEDKHCPEQ